MVSFDIHKPFVIRLPGNSQDWAVSTFGHDTTDDVAVNSAAITGCVACVKHTGPGPQPIMGGPMIKIEKYVERKK